jgi:hypothetical protein
MLFSRTFLGQGRFQGRDVRALGQGVYNPPTVPLIRWTNPLNTPLPSVTESGEPVERLTTPINIPSWGNMGRPARPGPGR